MEPDPPIPHSYAFHIFVLVLHIVLLAVLVTTHIWAPPFARGWRVGLWTILAQAAQVVGATVMAIAFAPVRSVPVTYRTGRLVYFFYGITGASATVIWAMTGVVGWVLLLGFNSSGRYTETGHWWLRRPWVAISMGVTGFVTAIVTAGDVWACAWLVPPKMVSEVEGGRGGVAATGWETAGAASADVQV